MKTGQRKESVIMGIRDSGWALSFTVITTMAGMLSFLTAGIKPMRWVGGITAATVFAVFAYIIILLPVLYSFGKDNSPEPDFVNAEGATKSDLRVEAMGKSILNKKWITVILTVLVAAAVIPGIFKIKVNMNYSDMMGERTPYIKRLRNRIGFQAGSL